MRESELALLAGDGELARVSAARGSPERPLSPAECAATIHDLAGDRFDRVLGDDARATDVLAALERVAP